MRTILVAALVGCCSCAEQPGAVPDDAGGAPSVDAAAPDLAVVGCMPACSGATPFCNASGTCVSCRTHEDCPPGQVCRPLGIDRSTCVPGCVSDDRCRAGGA